jgi:hypothetical protein
VQCLGGHISTFFNKDTCDLFMLCIVFMCQLHRVVFYYCCSLLLLLFVILFVARLFRSSFVRLLFSFDSLLFIVSLFKRKRVNSDPGLYSRYFDPIQPLYLLYKKYHHHLCKSYQTSYIRLHRLCLSIRASGLLQS